MKERAKIQTLVNLLAYYADGDLTRTELVSKLSEDREMIQMLPCPVSCFPPRETLRGEAEALHLAHARDETVTIGSNCTAPPRRPGEGAPRPGDEAVSTDEIMRCAPPPEPLYPTGDLLYGVDSGMVDPGETSYMRADAYRPTDLYSLVLRTSGDCATSRRSHPIPWAPARFAWEGWDIEIFADRARVLGTFIALRVKNTSDSPGRLFGVLIGSPTPPPEPTKARPGRETEPR